MPICARIPISKDRLANYPSVTKDQALEETVSPYSTVEDTIARHDVIKGQLSKVGVQGLVHTK